MSRKKHKTIANNKQPIFNNTPEILGAFLGSGTTPNDSSTPAGLQKVIRGYLVTQQGRSLLTQLYSEIGIIQSVIDQPVEDAFRGGIEVISDDMNEDEIQELLQEIEEHDDLTTYKNARRWELVFGGSGLIIDNGIEPNKPFNINQIKKGSYLKFFDADRWELNSVISNPKTTDYASTMPDTTYNYYGEVLDESRVIRFNGKRPPSLNRKTLQGWGLSTIEPLIRSLNNYFKKQDLIYELLDEAKIDIMGIEGLNSVSENQQAIQSIVKNLTMMQALKNYKNALIMDKNDTYSQKQLTFAGLADIEQQNLNAIASDTRQPQTKLFGQSSAGFNSGEDDLENYNGMIESTIRGTGRKQLLQVVKLRCKATFGETPETLKIKFKPLRVLSSEQEQNVKEKEFARITSALNLGLINEKQAMDCINRFELLPIRI